MNLSLTESVQRYAVGITTGPIEVAEEVPFVATEEVAKKVEESFFEMRT